MFSTTRTLFNKQISNTRTMASYSRLVRFHPKSDPSLTLIGQPKNAEQDVGLASFAKEDIEVEVFSGESILEPGDKTGKTESVDKLLSPLSAKEVGTIRCIGLNYINHAKEVNMALPEVPVLFLKPSTSLANPWPQPVIIPKSVVSDNAADYESEVVFVIGKECKNVSEDEAMDYLLGFTVGNDISSRVAQFAQSQWSYSKSFDGACPIGPAFIHKSQVKDIKDLKITGTHNGDVVQESKLDDLIFSIPKIISFLSQGTTMMPGTIVLTGTPAGVGWSCKPRRVLKQGDEFRVTLSHGVGTLISSIEEEQ